MNACVKIAVPSGDHRICLSALICLVILPISALAQDKITPKEPYAEAVRSLETFIAHEMADKDLPALSIALVDDQSLVWAKGFGFADPASKRPARAEAVYRVGSVSKLFTDIAIMQLVEHGLIDLDAPVTKYLPNFKPSNPSGKPITLRQLMAHRSGLVREPPVGHYFDATSPSLAQTVESLNGTELVYAPGTRTKYSNAGVSVAGYVLERTQGEPFARYLKRAVLDPLGLKSTSFEATPTETKDLATAYMWTYHGTSFAAPTFRLGTEPAGNLYSTVIDLGHFLSVLLAHGKGPAGPLLKSETLEQMWTPQFAPRDAKTAYGLGFRLDEQLGCRRVGHDGEVYGFATSLRALPDQKLGVAVVTTKDCASAVTRHIADEALALTLAVRQRRALPKIDQTTPIPAPFTRQLAGRYTKGRQGYDLTAHDGKLYLWPTEGGFRSELRMLGNQLVTDDQLSYGKKISTRADLLIVGSEEFKRAAAEKPAPIPERCAGLIGEYGWDYDTLYILEKDGKLQALIEWFFLYPLEEISENEYRFPHWGLYDGEKLVFRRDTAGRATEVLAGSVLFKRRHLDGEDGSTFRIQAQRPLAELRREALAVQPPKEPGSFRRPDLVDLAALDPGIRLDIRYATTNNFLSTPFYTSARAFMQRPAAEAVVRAHRRLKQQGYGVLIHDCYRPWYVTKMFWEATPEKSRIFVADPAKGSRHNRGCAIDLTLYDLQTGKPIQMTGGYDEMSDRSYPDYPGGTSLQRWHRELLRRTMEDEGFTVYEAEWWHYDYKDWRSYPILNLTFEQIEGAHH